MCDEPLHFLLIEDDRQAKVFLLRSGIVSAYTEDRRGTIWTTRIWKSWNTTGRLLRRTG